MSAPKQGNLGYRVSELDRMLMALEALGAKIDAVKDAIYALRFELRGGARIGRGKGLDHGDAQ